MVSLPRQVFRVSAASLSAIAVLALAGCGNNYRPVVSAINPVGPSTQPQVYATAIADPGNGNDGLATVINVFGETVAATASVAPSPLYFTVDSGGQAYVIHSGNSVIDSFSAAEGLMTTTVKHSSLAQNVNPTQITTNGTAGPVFIIEPSTSKVAVLSAGTPPTIRQELPVPANPVYTIANPSATRVYTLSQGTTPGTSTGTATAIEAGTGTANNAISASIPVGISPIYGVMTPDARRAFVLNQGSGTVTVINTVGNNLDKTITVGSNPIWADVAPAVNEIAVLNKGTGTSAGSLSIINVALCNQVALPGNAACDPNNPADAANFGTVLSTVPVGVNPVQVAILSDLSKAYVANADGTVTVVDMNTMVATKTITVGGSLNWIQAVAGNPTGKILVTAADTQTLTMIRTDTDVVTSTIQLQGKGIGIRVSQ
ncbi:YncE family protein [Terriglobus roseus]|uniref:40-residue YVTN family beta-propeller repeat-containing protein n=1 Tax=Terriglobus roseus TaxID=392734 RepID=A0A1G7IQQ0_9BACT|nr:YncE family protein [Terriglobus roseus]SDF15082.1 40-residue YVTN family beta-propeller repeat-containing protein [Terriglobus roseus]